MVKRNLLLFCLTLVAAVLLPKTINAQDAFTQSADSLSLHDSSTVVRYDTLRPMFASRRLSPIKSGSVTDKHYLNFKDYTYLGNWFNYLPFGYLQSPGVLGVPGELNLFGSGNGEVSILVDGIDFGDRLGGGFDAYEFPSEIIDTVEVSENTSGFLFSNTNNNSTVNFITRDKISIKPLTRIRYYQAKSDEAYVDAQFNIYPAKRLNLSMGITNSSVFSDYPNSEYGSWKGNIKARYLYNNTFNFIFSYYYTKLNSQLNGGIDYKKILRENYISAADKILYSSFEAPVNFSDRYQKVTKDKMIFTSLINLIPDNITTLDFYYFAELKEFRQNEKRETSEYPFIKDNNRSKTLGAKLLQKLSFAGFNLSAAVNIERNNYVLQNLNAEDSFSFYSVSAELSRNYFGNMEHSVFAKYLNYDGSGLSSFGTSFNYRLNNSFSITGGYSYSQRPSKVIEQLLSKKNPALSANNISAGIKFVSTYWQFNLKYFRQIDNKSAWNVIDKFTDTLKTHSVGSVFYSENSRSGINLFGSLKLWKILVEYNTSYYSESNDGGLKTSPEWTATGGIYFVDTLFNRNLKMKAGINIYAQGKQSFRIYDYENMLSAFYYTDVKGTLNKFSQFTKDSYQIDLFFSGMIRDRAILYLVLENVTDNKYFTTHYYPRKGINFRFGFAWELYN